jgi:limonene-1,2-epoxide hydrolase
MTEKLSPQEVLLAWNERYSNQDVAGAVKYMAPDLRRYGDLGYWEPVGVAAWQDMQERFFAAFPNWHWDIQSITANDNRVVIEFLEKGTFTLPYEVMPGLVLEPSGESYEDRSSIHFEVNDEGLIQEFRAYYTNNLHRTYQFLERIAAAGRVPLESQG